MLLGVASVLCLAQSSLADGKATGTLTAKGLTVQLGYVAAFVDQTDKDKRTVLVLSEKPVPSASWKSHSDVMTYHRNSGPLVGVVFRIDGQGEIDTAEYFVEPSPTSTSGIFEVTFDEKPGSRVSGTVKAAPAAAKLSSPVAIDAKFSVTVK